MQIFLDSAKIEEIKEALGSGCIDGVTTNPSLIAKAGVNFEKTIADIANLVKDSDKEWIVNAEVTHIETCEAMVAQGIRLAELHKNVVVKIPMTLEGINAVRELAKKNIRTNVTLCFSPNQAILAAKGGTTYVSPFIGRLDDLGENGMQMVSDIKKIYTNYGFKTKILAASIRSPLQVTAVALIGVDVATVSFEILKKMYKHPLTDVGIEQFNADWVMFQMCENQINGGNLK